MKFSKLAAQHRSALAALVNSGPLRTNQLSKTMGMRNDCGAAAHSLCQMRRIGLIFSKEKGNETYAEWEATDVGRAVFEARPADAPLAGLLSPKTLVEGVAKPTAYAVVPDTGFQVGTYEEALECAKAAAIGYGKPYLVIALAAEVLPPAAPQPVVNVL